MSKIKKRKTSLQAEMMAKKGYFRPIVVANRTGYHKSTIYRWIKECRVQAITFSSSYYVNWQSVLTLLGELADILGLESHDTRSNARKSISQAQS
jgi:predicted DNA-binding transcriptional regulator AlpA